MEILYSNLGNLTWQQVVMWAIGGLLIYLAIAKDMEPSLLLPMGFGAILVNLPMSGAIDQWVSGQLERGALSVLYDAGIANELFPLILFIGIVSRGGAVINTMIAYLKLAVEGATYYFFAVPFVIVLFLAVIAFIIVMTNAERRIPVQYAKRIVGNKQYGGVRQYIPLKINAAGVMPIIFAQALMFIPALFSKFESTSAIGTAFSNYSGFWYNLVFGLLVVAFTYFYTAITVNPNMMAEDMKRNGGFIPGVKPGKKTVDYLDTIMTRITLPGSVFLAIVAILPAFAMKLGINNQFALFYGGTSLLILVGVILDTLQQIESYLLLRHYDGLMKTGRIKGRSA